MNITQEFVVIVYVVILNVMVALTYFCTRGPRRPNRRNAWYESRSRSDSK